MKVFIAYVYAIPQLLAKKKIPTPSFFCQKLRDSIKISYEKFRFDLTKINPPKKKCRFPPPPSKAAPRRGGQKKKFFSPKVAEY